MSLLKKNLADKILVLGIDGMDPSLTKMYLDQGLMPNTKKFLEKGSTREDLVLLGAQPTVTPPMWTTLATGAYPCTHGITCFYRQSDTDLDVIEYNMDSTKCKAEQLWNVFAEAGKKTLVWHWPGSSWPPTSDSPNLHVVDGTQPGGVNIGIATTDMEKILVASTKTESIVYRSNAAQTGEIPCMVADLEVEEDDFDVLHNVTTSARKNIMLEKKDGSGVAASSFDISLSPIKPASGWENAPEGAMEFTILNSKGLIHRPALLIKNEEGIYDRLAVYKNKKSVEPLAIVKKGELVRDVIDDAIKNDEVVQVNRDMRILELADDGTYLKLWISTGLNIAADAVWHPKSLHKLVCENVGYPPAVSLAGGSDKHLFYDCMKSSWDVCGKWTADSIKYLIKENNYDVVFSHFHNVDLQGHMIVKFLKDGGDMPAETYQEFLQAVYVQTDEYIGHYLPLLDEGWTIVIVSDHGQICPEHESVLICDEHGVNIRIMEELGYTAVKKDENGNDLHEIDWEHTKAVQVRGNHLYINLKGRDKHGIVDPADKYDLEEEIISAVYNYRDPKTGKRVISIAMRNRDAVLLGMGGPDSGDILLWTAEGFNLDHCDSLSTTRGFYNTSVSPLFMAAGPGIKAGYKTDRIIREVDVAPTVAVLGGVRMPAQCEGAPVYQILTETF
ncbi:MAG: alkaline phosphatase family protein [Peptococcaceae bacterium]|nr:alkaline phosphatase family protein [Peptococcaceae bacterium]